HIHSPLILFLLHTPSRLIPPYLARPHVAQPLPPDGVNDPRRHLLARPEPPADRQPHHLSGFILVPLVPQADGGGLPAVAQLLGKHRRIKVECEHGSAPQYLRILESFIQAWASLFRAFLRRRSPARTRRRRGAPPRCPGPAPAPAPVFALPAQ